MTQPNMKPVVIFRFLAHEGPGYLGDYLDANSIPWQLIKVDESEPAPSSILACSGMVLMGGPMSVNDDLPWITSILALVHEARDNDIPVLGHCLGGQLMSKALGVEVTKNAIKEIGWGEVSVSKNAASKNWFGNIETFNAFHWHGETFALPEGATHLLSSPYCQNQAWSIGKHLAFQTHIEMTAEMVTKWCEEGVDELESAKASPAAQTAAVMQENLVLHVFFLQKVAKQVYSQWIQGLKR